MYCLHNHSYDSNTALPEFNLLGHRYMTHHQVAVAKDHLLPARGRGV